MKIYSSPEIAAEVKLQCVSKKQDTLQRKMFELASEFKAYRRNWPSLESMDPEPPQGPIKEVCPRAT